MNALRKTLETAMNVLHVATLNRPIRQDLGYGPIESIIYSIDKGLHQLGHRSIVACSGDSRVAGEHYVTIARSFSEYWSTDTPHQRRRMAAHLLKSLERARKGDIDIIHMHDAVMVKYLYRGLIRSPVPIVMTLHVPAEETGSFKRWCESLRSASEVHFVPISARQKQQYHGLVNTTHVIHHGIDVDDYPFKTKPDDDGYLFTIGRITPVKGQDKAIDVARTTGSKLIIAGCVQNKREDRAFFKQLQRSIDLCVDAGQYPADDDYYQKVMKPIIDGDQQIVYIGEISRGQKKLWYRRARATLFPIQWGEPFGLVLIESMACGTPILALNKGSVPEIVIHGETGFVVDSLSAMRKAVGHLQRIDPGACRRHVQRHFSITRMAQQYAALYQQILDGRRACRANREYALNTIAQYQLNCPNAIASIPPMNSN